MLCSSYIFLCKHSCSLHSRKFKPTAQLELPLKAVGFLNLWECKANISVLEKCLSPSQNITEMSSQRGYSHKERSLVVRRCRNTPALEPPMRAEAVSFAPARVFHLFGAVGCQGYSEMSIHKNTHFHQIRAPKLQYAERERPLTPQSVKSQTCPCHLSHQMINTRKDLASVCP